MLKIKDVIYDYDCSPGCETCDYGSSYVSNIKIIFRDDTVLSIETDQMYEWMFSESDYMRILSNSESIEEIIFKVLNSVKEWESIEDVTIKINDKELDVKETHRKSDIIYKKEKHENE